MTIEGMIRGRKITFAAVAIMAMAVACIVISCGYDADIRTDEQSGRMTMIEDTMDANPDIAMTLCDSMQRDCKDSMDYYDFETLKAKIYLLTDSPQKALPILQQVDRFALNNHTSARNYGLMALARSIEASVYHVTRQNNDKAIKLNIQAMELMMKSDIKEKCPELAANLADTYIYVDNMPEAAKWYRRALFLVDSLALPKKLNVTLYMGLAQIYANIEDFNTAKHYYELTDKQYDNIKNNLKLYFLNNYGNFYYFQADYNNALAMFKRMEREIDNQHSSTQLDRALCDINMADVYLNLNMTDSAQIYLDMAEPIFIKVGVDVGIFYANTIRMGIAIKQNRYAVIDSILKNEPDMLIEQSSMRAIRYRYLKQYHEHKGDYKKAYETAETASKEKVVLTDKLNNMRLAEIMNRFTEDTIRLHHKIAISEKDASLAKARNMGGALVAVVLMMALAMLAGYVNIRRKRTKARMDMILLRLGNVRQRISPHFIFNVLNSKICKENNEEADTLLKLTKLIRANLDMSCKICVTMKEELDFVKKYVEIENNLIHEDIMLEICNEKNIVLDDIVIPSMFVQILVENSILHGLKGKKGDKIIKINIAQDHDNTYVHIIDNGRGFDIRRNEGSGTRNGLNIIRHTIAVINSHKPSSLQMEFDITNIETDDGNIKGCDASYTIPRNLNLIKKLY